jgi:hypothetical protein
VPKTAGMKCVTRCPGKPAAEDQPNRKEGTMKRLFLAMLTAGALLLLSPAFASQAMAATTTSVSMTFTEPLLPDVHSGCVTFPETQRCGHGQVIPYGQATEIIVFGGACGGSCDLRTITLAGGTITLDETLSNVICAGACTPNPGDFFSGTLTDVVVGGTGEFSGASGNLSGSVTHAGGVAVITLSGTITLP